MERELIERIRAQAKQDGRLEVGIGDDAAILTRSGRSFVVTVDMLTEGVDFLSGQVSPRLIGRKSLAVNLSDLAAMGAEADSVFVAVALPRSQPVSLADELTAGILELAHEYNVLLAGGDVNCWSEGLVVSITAIGKRLPEGALLRSAARPGDVLLATGGFGGSMLGRQFLFTPRLREAVDLVRRYGVDAGMDVSDGLLLDLNRFAMESRVGFLLDDASVPIHPDVERAAICVRRANLLVPQYRTAAEILNFRNCVQFPVADPETISEEEILGIASWLCGDVNDETGLFDYDPLFHALSDGEDFELLLAARPETAEVLLRDQPLVCYGTELTRLGEFLPESAGRKRKTRNGNIVTAQACGFLHHMEDINTNK
ncbi:MAG: thiamine-phosphate kinase [Planctomycetia bacterium]|nr:thiamine-phosphate kinase [Planctomycetia bacterium]